MKNIRYYNCPECDKPTFIKADDESNHEAMSCEHCGSSFNVATDTRPFVMCTHLDNSDKIYAC